MDGQIDPNTIVMPELGKPDLGPESTPENGDFQGLVDYCMNIHKKFLESSYRKEKIQEIIESRTAYKQKEDPAKANFPFKNSSNLTLPFTTIMVDNLEPRLVSGLVGVKPVVRFKMEGVTDPDEITKILETWFNNELEEKINIETKTMSIVNILLKEGTWFGIPRYDQEEMIQRDFQYNPQTGFIIIDPGTGKPITKDVPVLLYEGGKLETVPFTDILCADDLGTIEEWEKADKIRLIRPTYGDLMRSRNKIGYLPDKIGPWLIGQKDKKQEKSSDQQTPAQTIEEAKYIGKETIECAEFYVTYHINKDEDAPEEEQSDFTEERLLVTIHLATKTLIRITLLREINFSNESIVKRIRMFPEEGLSYGTSAYGKIKSIQNGASDFFNAVLNIAYIVMIPWFFYEESAGLRGQIELIPGKGVPVDSVKGILIPTFNINPAAYLNFIEMFIGLWERIGSVANPQIGRQSDTDKTATEIMMVIQEGNIKFEYQAKTMKQEYISVLKTLYDGYYQFMPYNAMLQVNGKMMPFPRMAMKRGYKFLLTGSTATANKMLERKEAEDLYALSQTTPLLNPLPIIEDLLKTRGKMDLNRYINPQGRAVMDAMAVNPEIPQVVANYLAEKKKLQADIEIQTEGGGNGPPKRPTVPRIPG